MRCMQMNPGPCCGNTAGRMGGWTCLRQWWHIHGRQSGRSTLSPCTMEEMLWESESSFNVVRLPPSPPQNHFYSCINSDTMCILGSHGWNNFYMFVAAFPPLQLLPWNQDQNVKWDVCFHRICWRITLLNCPTDHNVIKMFHIDINKKMHFVHYKNVFGVRNFTWWVLMLGPRITTFYYQNNKKVKDCPFTKSYPKKASFVVLWTQC